MLNSKSADERAVQSSGLEHRVYQPENCSASGACVIMVHGRAGDPTMMWTFSKSFQQHKPLTVAPQGFLEDPIGKYYWWPLERRPVPEADKIRLAQAKFPPALDRLEKFVLSLPELYGADLNQLYAVGFSQGAGLVSMLSLIRPRLFKGVVLLAGFVPGVLREHGLLLSEGVLQGAEALPEYFIAHGTEDRAVTLEKAEAGAEFLRGLGATVRFHTDKVGHKVGSSALKALEHWFSEQLSE